MLRGGLQHDVLKIEGELLSKRGFVRVGVVMQVSVAEGYGSDL